MSSRVRVGAALAVLLGAVVCHGVFATEPDGATALRWSWEPGPPVAGSEATLKLTVEAIVPIADLTLRLESPDGVGVRLVGVALVERDGRYDLGSLPSHGVRTFAFSVRAPASGGGVLAIHVQGRAPFGAVAEGAGVVVGRPGVAPVLRDGALEFPAVRRGSKP